MKKNLVLILLLLFSGCTLTSKTHHVINKENISGICINKKLTSTGNTSVDAYISFDKYENADFYCLDEVGICTFINILNSARKYRLAQSKFGKGVVLCKLKRRDCNEFERIVICRNLKNVLICNLSNNICYSIAMQSEDYNRLTLLLALALK